MPALPARPGRLDAPRAFRWPWAVAAALAVTVTAGGLLSLGADPSLDRPPTHLREDIVRMVGQGRKAYAKGDYEEAVRVAERAVALGRTRMLADAMADGLFLWGEALAAQGDLEAAEAKLGEALAAWRVLEHQHGLGAVLENLGILQARLGKTEQARASLEASIAAFRKMPDHPVNIAGPARALGSLAAVDRDYASAKRWYGVARQELEKHPDPGSERDLRALEALVARDEGRLLEALAKLERCLAEWEADGQQRWVATTLCQIASVHEMAGDAQRARECYDRAARIYRAVGDRRGYQVSANLAAGPPDESIGHLRRVEEFF